MHFTLKNLSEYLLAARMFYNANEVIVKLKKNYICYMQICGVVQAVLSLEGS